MTARQRRRAPPPPPAYVPGTLLNWNDSRHWDYDRALPCRYCGFPTQLLDSGRHHAHKTCAEDALSLQAAEAADAYQNGQN